MNEKEKKIAAQEMTADTVRTMLSIPLFGATVIIPGGGVMVAAKCISQAAALGQAADDAVMGLAIVFGAACSTVSVVALGQRLDNIAGKVSRQLTGWKPTV